MTIILLAFLITIWVFAAVCVIGLVGYFGHELDRDRQRPPGSDVVDLIIGLSFVGVLSLAPIMAILIARVN